MSELYIPPSTTSKKYWSYKRFSLAIMGCVVFFVAFLGGREFASSLSESPHYLKVIEEVGGNFVSGFPGNIVKFTEEETLSLSSQRLVTEQGRYILKTTLLLSMSREQAQERVRLALETEGWNINKESFEGRSNTIVADKDGATVRVDISVFSKVRTRIVYSISAPLQ